MPTIKLTDRTVAHIKPPKAGRIELWDSMLPGFGLRVTDNDARTWFVMYRAGMGEDRKQRRLKIGDAKLMDLAEAREGAREAMRQVAKGIDPAAERPAPALASGTVRAIASDYLARYVKKNTRPSTHKETKRIFDIDVLPAWGGRPLASITRRDAGELLAGIAERGAEVQANRTLARLKTFFGWCVDEEIISASPVGRMKPPTKERARDRALTDDEIRWFWKGCDLLEWPFGPLFKLLLLTAQRRDEVAAINFAELDLEKRLWTIPRERAKNDRAHEVPLSELALEILQGAIADRPPIDGEQAPTLIFTTTGKTAVSGFSRAKERLDAEMAKLAGKPMSDWILHDLRRSAATGMARLNIAPHVVDKVLNHVSGTIRGVAAVFNRFGYLDERNAALGAWGRYVETLIRGVGDNVMTLRAAR